MRNREKSLEEGVGERIVIVGARQHNLRVDRLELPKRRLIVFTGVSGSGKSSMAFDTLYAEGQRRYIESLTSYARQFLGRLDRPDVERLSGLSPTIAIEQKSASSNPRSTVGTITEVYDYLRVLYARVGQQHCHVCGKPVQGQSSQEIVDTLLELPGGERLLLLAPLVTHRKGEFRDLLAELAGRGYLRVRIDGTVCRLDETQELDKKRKHTIELVVDRVTLSADDRQRISESVELALQEGKGEMRALRDDGRGAALELSESRTCCGHSFPQLSPQSFSFNSPLGMCPACNGLGTRLEVDPKLVVPDERLSVNEGALVPWAHFMRDASTWNHAIITTVAALCDIDLDRPWNKLGQRKQEVLLHGLGDRTVRVRRVRKNGAEVTWPTTFEGVIDQLERRYRETSSEAAREGYRQFMGYRPCEACQGKRLRPESLAVLIDGRSIAEVSEMTVRDAHRHFTDLSLAGSRAAIAEGVLREVRGRLEFLLDVGLDYLSLGRGGPTLSGGEAQRIRLASQLGSELSGVMYVLDEPSIGLHQRDNRRLVRTLKGLRDLGNTVVVVEHDEETIRSADHVVDFGPGAGHMGGEVVFAGTPRDLVRSETSLTGLYLAGTRSIPLPAKRRAPGKHWVTVRGAAQNNLCGIDVGFPIGTFTAVTGVSGAGKSSLVSGILLPALSRALHRSSVDVGAHKGIDGLDALDKVIAIDQKPIGRTPRSNPGTYTKAFDEIREVFAALPDSRARGYSPGRFSFNVKGGRCEACQGDGVIKVEMHFLADVYVTCEVCQGRRYNAQTLQVRYQGRSIADVLDMSVDECLALFASYPTLSRILRTLVDVGLGYVKIGQSAPTLSGGEAQRVKLSRELGKRETGRTLYVLDEPTTGLHFEDIRKLLEVLRCLVDAGNTVVVIEHNLEVVKCADWVIDLGPEGGDRGGRLVAAGPPEAIARVPESFTGVYLGKVLEV